MYTRLVVDFNSGQILRFGPGAKNQFLLIFGFRHSNNPEDPQFDELSKLWTEFRQLVGRQKVVFTEGVPRDMPGPFKESIVQRGEVGAAQWLARESDIQVQCPEPNEHWQREELVKIFNPEDVAYAFVAQRLASWAGRKGDKTSLETEIEVALKREVKYESLYRFKINLDWFKKHHQDLFPTEKLSDAEFLNRIVDPRRLETIINKVVAERTKLRNKYIYEKIEEVWQSSGDLLVVYGLGHVLSLAGRLENLVSAQKPIPQIKEVAPK